MFRIRKHAPNIISLIRVFLCIPFVLFLHKNLGEWAFATILIGAVSDYLDGALARKYCSESAFGKILDPIADKVFTNSVLWSMCYYGYDPGKILVFVAIILTMRDCLLMFGGLYVLIKNGNKIDIRPVYLSKVCTFLVFLLCLLTFVFEATALPFRLLSGICMGVIIIVLFKYVQRLREQIRLLKLQKGPQP